MNRETNIRTTIKLPCSFILCGTDHKFVLGVTEFLTRDSLVALISLAAPAEWLNDTASVIVAVDLPCTGLSEPRVLECAATVSRVRPSTWGMRVEAKVNRMKFQNRENYLLKHNCTGARQSGVESLLAIRKSRALQPVTALRHQKRFTKLFNQQGEHNMSFLKNFFVEEDGQDMVEYGLVIALVVLAAVAILTGFKTNIGTAFTALGSDVTTNVK